MERGREQMEWRNEWAVPRSARAPAQHTPREEPQIDGRGRGPDDPPAARGSRAWCSGGSASEWTRHQDGSVNDPTQTPEPLAALIASAVLCITYFLLRASWAIGSRTIRQLITQGEKTCVGLFTELLREEQVHLFVSEHNLADILPGVEIPAHATTADRVKALQDALQVQEMIALTKHVCVMIAYSADNDGDGTNQVVGVLRVEYVCTIEHAGRLCDLPASGLQWESLGNTAPSFGRAINNDSLKQSLVDGKLSFTAEQYGAFGVASLLTHDYIKAGDSYYRPVAAVPNAENWATIAAEEWDGDYRDRVSQFEARGRGMSCAQCGALVLEGLGGEAVGSHVPCKRPRAPSRRLALMGTLLAAPAGFDKVRPDCNHRDGGPHRMSLEWLLAQRHSPGAT